LLYKIIKKANKVKSIYICTKNNFSFKAINNINPNSFNLNTKTQTDFTINLNRYKAIL